jgi:putative peptidoglycan lipid II flippase
MWSLQNKSSFWYLFVLSAILVGLGKILALVKDVFISYYFGATPQSDAFFIANMVPSIFWLAFHATINIVFLPLYVKAKADSSSKVILREATIIYSSLAIVSAGFTLMFADTVVDLTAAGASVAIREQAFNMVVIMTIGYIFSGYVTIQNVVQQVEGRTLAPLTVPVFNNVVALASIPLAAYLGMIEVAVGGAVLGWILQTPIHQYITKRFRQVGGSLRVRSETLKILTLLSLPVMLVTFLDQVTIYIGTQVASFYGPGAISHLNFATRLVLFLSGFFSLLLGYLVFPTFAKWASLDNLPKSEFVLQNSVILLLFITLPIVGICLLKSEEIVNIVFGYGKFTNNDVRDTSELFYVYCIAILFMSFREIFSRFLFSFGQTKSLLFCALVSVATGVVSVYPLTDIMGISGIATASVLSSIIFVTMQIYFVRMMKVKILSKKLSIYTLIFIVSSFFSGFIIHLIFGSNDGIDSIDIFITSSMIYLFIYLLTTILLSYIFFENFDDFLDMRELLN